MKAGKARTLTTLEEADDPCVRNAGIRVDIGRKADTEESVKDAKAKLREEEIAGVPNRGREGLGLNPKRVIQNKKERRTAIVEKVRETEEDRRRVKMTGLARQGGHLKWEVPEKRITSSDLISMPEDRLKFLVKDMYDLL